MTRKPDTPPDEVPADLADLDDEALAALTAKLTADFDKLLDEGSRDVATMTAIADDITRVGDEVKARKAAEDEADAEIAKLAERVKGATPVEPDPEPEPDPVPDPEVPAEPEATADPAPAPEPAPEKELVTAAATSRPALGDIARRVPRPRVEARRTPAVSITASSDLPGVRPDAEMTTLQLAEAMHDRARTLSDDGKRAPVASIQIPHTHWLGTDPTENARSIQDLVGEPNAAALVASGGWCAPSTPLFELFDLGPDTDDLFDLPGIGQQVRAGVMVPTFYGVGDVAGALWNWTEAQDIAAATQPAGPDKPCLKIPCPTWTESRLEAEGLCVTHGNLSDRAWPELTRQFLSTVMGAHQRRISAAKVAKVLAGATVVAPGAGMTPSDAAGDVLNVVSLAAADMRSQYRVSKSRSIDMLFPQWLLEVFRGTLAMRAGVDLLSVTDSDVVSYLTAKNVRPQFTPDWQPLYNAAPATAWPANVTFLSWFTGAYVSIDGGQIDLGVVRDSTLNSTNDFTAAWSEQFFQVVRRGPLARSYTVPLGVDGVTACCP
jgi:hypothetical protein